MKLKRVVKEEMMDDEAKLPCVNGRVVAWLVQVEGSIAGSDNKSTHSLNLNDFNSNKQQNDNLAAKNNQFSSMQSVSSTTSSNNENYDSGLHLNRKSSKQHQQQNQIYDTLNGRKNSLSTKTQQRQIVTPLK